ncbi:cupin domain-containing protein [Kitasatospora aureofaciens]|uniref:cupin domain-containing protein n=1 Tax=Kitasatospora aureofaciens TaxID=1894 RepID=UPI001C44DA40|nr:cupin domain-containing protein [Kitasatospora aureofaciens]MBV6696710.1 cupin domain-containing protein [Kitasatospora aureofaciens]
MRSLDCGSAVLTAEYGIRIGRWTQYPEAAKLPFDAMWCVVGPGSSSVRDCHPEVELAVVVTGRAEFEVEGAGTTAAPTGTAVLLDPQERHVIHNRSQTDPLTVLSIYWLPDGDTADEGAADGNAADGDTATGTAATGTAADGGRS